MQTDNDDAGIGVVWGAEAIADLIGATTKRTFYLLETGAIPAKKVRGRWCASRRVLREFFEESA